MTFGEINPFDISAIVTFSMNIGKVHVNVHESSVNNVYRRCFVKKKVGVTCARSYFLVSVSKLV